MASSLSLPSRLQMVIGVDQHDVVVDHHPASAITPIPVMTIPNGWFMIIRPRKTPMVDMTTADRTSADRQEPVELGQQHDKDQEQGGHAAALAGTRPRPAPRLRRPFSSGCRGCRDPFIQLC
jgi:hypothetical protein